NTKCLLLIGGLNGGAGDFEEFFERDGRGGALAHSLQKCGCAAIGAFILPPEAHGAEAWPPEGAQRPEIVELQDAPAAEDFEAFLGKGLVAVGQIVDGAGRSVGVGNADADTLLIETGDLQGFGRAAGQVAEEIQEMAGFPTDSPSSRPRIQGPVFRGDPASVHGIEEDFRPGYGLEQLTHAY